LFPFASGPPYHLITPAWRRHLLFFFDFFPTLSSCSSLFFSFSTLTYSLCYSLVQLLAIFFYSSVSPPFSSPFPWLFLFILFAILLVSFAFFRVFTRSSPSHHIGSLFCFSPLFSVFLYGTMTIPLQVFHLGTCFARKNAFLFVEPDFLICSVCSFYFPWDLFGFSFFLVPLILILFPTFSLSLYLSPWPVRFGSSLFF